MMNITLGIAILLLMVAFVWRVASRSHSIPCPVWLRWLVELDNPFTKTNRAATIIEHLDLRPGMVVLDAGCGPGRITVPVAKHVGKQGSVTAMDIQMGMIERTREKALSEGLHNIRYLHAGLGQGTLGKNLFDRAILVTVLGEIPNREAALKEIFESLKPGGMLSLTEIIFDPHFQPRATVAGLIKAVGFREKDFFGNSIVYTMNAEKPG
jgi:ubiquinone/menaquinone biosynthesis C-methylase UbiE